MTEVATKYAKHRPKGLEYDHQVPHLVIFITPLLGRLEGVVVSYWRLLVREKQQCHCC